MTKLMEVRTLKKLKLLIAFLMAFSVLVNLMPSTAANVALANVSNDDIITEQALRSFIENAGTEPVTIVVNNNINLTSPILITENRNITLLGSATLTVSSNIRHFIIHQDEGSLTLTGSITLTRASGYTGHGGGVIVSAASNEYDNNAHLTLRDNTAIVNNSVGGNTPITGNGGGVFLNGGTVNLHDESRIDNNTAALGGGGVSATTGLRCGVYMHDNSSISNNTAGHGGAIVFGDLDDFQMHGGVIDGNNANGNGGAIISGSGTTFLEMFNGAITNNTAAGNGGAIHTTAYGAISISENMVFSGNQASASYDFGLEAGELVFPFIRWYGYNSVPGTHLLNNYDISFTGQTIEIRTITFYGNGGQILPANQERRVPHNTGLGVNMPPTPVHPDRFEFDGWVIVDADNIPEGDVAVGDPPVGDVPEGEFPDEGSPDGELPVPPDGDVPGSDFPEEDVPEGEFPEEDESISGETEDGPAPEPPIQAYTPVAEVSVLEEDENDLEEDSSTAGEVDSEEAESTPEEEDNVLEGDEFVLGGDEFDSEEAEQVPEPPTPIEGIPFTATTSVTEDITVWARWGTEILPEYSTVTFDLNGGTGDFPPQIVAHGDLATEPTEEPTRAGYTFLGWYTTTEAGEVAFNFETTPIVRDITLQANWGGGDATTPPNGEDTTTPPGGEDTTTPPGAEDTTTPPGGDEETTTPEGEDITTPPGDEDTTTPPGGEDDEDTTTPDGEGDEETTTPDGEDETTPQDGESRPLREFFPNNEPLAIAVARALNTSANPVTIDTAITLADLAEITRLTTGYSGQQERIESLAGIEQLVNLEHLAALRNPARYGAEWLGVSDIAPLENLTSLEHLTLQGHSVSNIRPLAGLTNLRHLNLGLNQLMDLRPLAPLLDSDSNLENISVINQLIPLEVTLEVYYPDGGRVAVTPSAAGYRWNTSFQHAGSAVPFSGQHSRNAAVPSAPGDDNNQGGDDTTGDNNQGDDDTTGGNNQGGGTTTGGNNQGDDDTTGGNNQGGGTTTGGGQATDCRTSNNQACTTSNNQTTGNQATDCRTSNNQADCTTGGNQTTTGNATGGGTTNAGATTSNQLPAAGAVDTSTIILIAGAGFATLGTIIAIRRSKKRK